MPPAGAGVPLRSACGDYRGVERFRVVTSDGHDGHDGGPGAPDLELSQLVEREILGLRRLAYARTGDWAAAEDVVQDVLSDAHRRWDVLRGYREPAAWARRAVLNRAASWHRRRGRENRALMRLAGRGRTEATIEATEPRFADPELWTAIRSLSDRQVDVVLLLWFEDLSAREVAEVLRCGEDTVRTHWRRARARLAQELGERVEERP